MKKSKRVKGEKEREREMKEVKKKKEDDREKDIAMMTFPGKYHLFCSGNAPLGASLFLSNLGEREKEKGGEKIKRKGEREVMRKIIESKRPYMYHKGVWSPE